MSGELLVVGDVIQVPFPGDNGVTKVRYSVVLERCPPHQPIFLIVISCCSETKTGAANGDFIRIDDDETIERMDLNHASTFHIEDIRAYDVRSPTLSPRRPGSGRAWGRAHPEDLPGFQRLKRAFFEQDRQLQLELLPRGRASAAAQAGVAAYVAQMQAQQGT